MNTRNKITHSYGRAAAKLAIGFVFAVVGVLCMTGRAHASVSPTGTYLASPNNLFAYVQSGENLDTTFTKAINGSFGTDVAATITVSRPGAADVNCSISAASVAGTSCGFTNLTATTSGIWQIHFQHTIAVDYYSWSIVVQNGSTNIPGRVWSETYDLAQPGGTPPAGTDFVVWYQSEFGYQYQAGYSDYNGIQSIIQASGVGLVKSGGGCTPLYKSVNQNDTNFALAPASCEADYKLFFEQMASDLPTSATRWDGDTDWVLPPVENPVISNIAFTSTTANSRDGNVSFNLSNYIGLVTVYVDTNDNGNYNDPGDVSIPVVGVDGANTVAFDGKDGNGATISNSQKLNFKVAIEHVAEIHFLMTDVELRGGGIAVQRLNGSGGGQSTIYWDDLDLADPDANRCSFTANRNGTAGVDSTGGVHAWDISTCPPPNYGNYNDFIHGSWGDGRIINDWAYAAANTFQVVSLSGYTDPGTPTLPDTGQNSIQLLALAGFLVITPALTLMVLRQQSK